MGGRLIFHYLLLIISFNNLTIGANNICSDKTGTLTQNRMSVV